MTFMKTNQQTEIINKLNLAIEECKNKDLINTLSQAISIINEQQAQLQDWEKYVPFLYAHGIIKEIEWISTII